MDKNTQSIPSKHMTISCNISLFDIAVLKNATVISCLSFQKIKSDGENKALKHWNWWDMHHNRDWWRPAEEVNWCHESQNRIQWNLGLQTQHTFLPLHEDLDTSASDDCTTPTSKIWVSSKVLHKIYAITRLLSAGTNSHPKKKRVLKH